ncbi:MAG: cytochrome c biogenesis protein ResB, partial [Nitrospirota bacterium]
MAKDQDKTIIDRAWDFMASVKMAIILFALISLSSIVGTVIEQNATPDRNLEVISTLFGESLAPTLYVVFERLGFMDMYRSWWFLTLLLLFAANLFICSVDRFPRIYRLIKEPIKPMEREKLLKIPVHRELTLQGKPESVKDTVARAAKKAGIKVRESSEGGEVRLFGEKWRFARLGVYVTHFSVIIILVGAVAGIFFGFKGYVNIPEGATYFMAFRSVGMLTQEQTNERNIIVDAVGRASGDVAAAAARLGVGEEHLRARMKRFGILPLGFGLRVEDFEVEFYGQSDMPKEYLSILTVIDGGREVMRKKIEVNDPLKYNGITFYQSSYGLMQGSDFNFVFRVSSGSGNSDMLAVRKGQELTIPGTDIRAKVVEFYPALAFDPTGTPFTYAEQMNNPAVKLHISGPTGEYAKWVTKRNPQTWSLATGESIEFRDAFGAQYTGIEVRRDPGVWIVYLGCALMAVGLYIAFFANHKKLWMALSPSKGGSTTVTV